ncbi:ABC transporter permease [Naasia sp. SYSU D00948]|uniref:ABC transporter permease n=1 Tax=Naasia sp. SYSU D00948 TaxID=2817379 RepID=UPI001B300F9F|nr:ABC transporter permease subunit [Naasia sp. SYSU D00948]
MTAARSVLTGLLHYWPLALIVVLWDLWVVVNGYTETVAPRPWAVFADVGANVGEYVPDLAYTLVMSLAGLGLGTLAALIAGIGVWRSAAISGVVTPAALVLRSVPVTAMIPVIARLLGYNDSTVLAITAIICFFPVFVFTVSGLASASQSGRDLFAVLGASTATTLRRLHLLTAVPSIMVAIRITAPTAVLAAMLAEFLIGAHGLGHLFSTARSYMEMDRAWGTAVVATALSVLTFVGARALERAVVARVT